MQPPPVRTPSPPTVLPHDEKDDGASVIPPTAPMIAGALGDVNDVRVAVIGNVDAGKSTLIGVLTSGILDDARGSARSRVFHFKHELSKGRTSAVGHHIMGFDAKGTPIRNVVAATAKPAAKNRAWGAVVSRARQLITFIDLAGHARYLKTTVAGLTGCYPDLALVIVNSLAGVTKMTREHLGIAIALGIPLCVVVTKIDRAFPEHLKDTKHQLSAVLKSRQAGKLPVTIRSEADVDAALSDLTRRATPIFYVSAVSGQHIDLLLRYLAHFEPSRAKILAASAGVAAGVAAALQAPASASSSLASAAAGAATGGAGAGAEEAATEAPPAPAAPPATGELTVAQLTAAPTELRIDERFQVSGTGLVVSGTLTSGSLEAGQRLLLGPDARGRFVDVAVKSVHCKRVPVERGVTGDSCSVALRAVPASQRTPATESLLVGPPPSELTKGLVKRGMVLVSASARPRAAWAYDADVVILHHPTTIRACYQAVVHCGVVRQTAAIESMAGRDALVTGDTARIRIRFTAKPEFLRPGEVFLFRDGSTKGLGRVVAPVFSGSAALLTPSGGPRLTHGQAIASAITSTLPLTASGAATPAIAGAPTTTATNAAAGTAAAAGAAPESVVPTDAVAAESLVSLPVELRVDERFQIAGVGLVVSGMLSSGSLHPGQRLLLGPGTRSRFIRVTVASIQVRRKNVPLVEAGKVCSVALTETPTSEPTEEGEADVALLPPQGELTKSLVKCGMVLVAAAARPRPAWAYDVLVGPQYPAQPHSGVVRQPVTVEVLKTDKDTSTARLRFENKIEYLCPGKVYVFHSENSEAAPRFAAYVTAPSSALASPSKDRRSAATSGVSAAGGSSAGSGRLEARAQAAATAREAIARGRKADAQRHTEAGLAAAEATMAKLAADKSNPALAAFDESIGYGKGPEEEDEDEDDGALPLSASGGVVFAAGLGSSSAGPAGAGGVAGEVGAPVAEPAAAAAPAPAHQVGSVGSDMVSALARVMADERAQNAAAEAAAAAAEAKARKSKEAHKKEKKDKKEKASRRAK